jgi:hypothetical protein
MDWSVALTKGRPLVAGVGLYRPSGRADWTAGVRTAQLASLNCGGELRNPPKREVHNLGRVANRQSTLTHESLDGHSHVAAS